MIEVQDLSIVQGDFKLSDVSFSIPAESYGVLMGRTGCGKTSIVEAICGLRKIRSGRIVLHGRDVSALRPSERGVGYVPQDGALFDTMSVRQHVAFALRIRKWSRNDIENRVAELAQLLEIENLLDRTPHGLSGGERQRVALGRALSFEPQILLLDEPLSAVDDSTRQHLYEVIRRVRRHRPFTALHVTHRSSEAKTLGDELLFLTDGRVSRECPNPPTETGN